MMMFGRQQFSPEARSRRKTRADKSLHADMPGRRCLNGDQSRSRSGTRMNSNVPQHASIAPSYAPKCVSLSRGGVIAR
jgi:hypothetical protein